MRTDANHRFDIPCQIPIAQYQVRYLSRWLYEACRGSNPAWSGRRLAGGGV